MPSTARSRPQPQPLVGAASRTAPQRDGLHRRLPCTPPTGGPPSPEPASFRRFRAPTPGVERRRAPVVRMTISRSETTPPDSTFEIRTSTPICPSGGIGRRAWLRAMWPLQAVEVRVLSRAHSNAPERRSQGRFLFGAVSPILRRIAVYRVKSKSCGIMGERVPTVYSSPTVCRVARSVPPGKVALFVYHSSCRVSQYLRLVDLDCIGPQARVLFRFDERIRRV